MSRGHDGTEPSKSVRLISRGNVQASQSLTSPLSLLAPPKSPLWPGSIGNPASPRTNLGGAREDPSSFLDLLAMAEMVVSDEGAEDVEDDAAGELRRIVVDVVGRGDLNHLHAAQALRRNRVDDLQSLAR